MNIDLSSLTPESVKALKGHVVTGDYKRPNRTGIEELKIEVTAIAALPTTRGTKAYVVGTRLDGDQAGNVQAIRLDGFMGELAVSVAPEFKPVDLTNFFVGADPDHYAWLEEVEGEKFVAYAEKRGGKRLSNFVVAPAVEDAL